VRFAENVSAWYTTSRPAGCCENCSPRQRSARRSWQRREGERAAHYSLYGAQVAGQERAGPVEHEKVLFREVARLLLLGQQRSRLVAPPHLVPHAPHPLLHLVLLLSA
jgi:hypothetical protein